jgi:glycolate oxidase subunit GlcD
MAYTISTVSRTDEGPARMSTLTTTPIVSPAKGAMTPAFIAACQAIVGKKYVLAQIEERLSYECDACMLLKTPPDLVVLPGTPNEAAALVTLCHDHAIPFVARGAGTGLSGGALAIEGGVILSLNRLNHILSIDSISRFAWVEVGVVNATLNERLAPLGLFYAPDPSSQGACTVGGNVAENAGGIHCFKHGVTTDHILALELVLPTGQTVTLGHPTTQSGKDGLDLLRLLIGSEGTLGVVTKVCLRLMPKPAQANVILAAFGKIEHAGDAVAGLVARGLEPAAIEMMDGLTIWAVNQAFNMGFPDTAQALLLVELSGQWAEANSETETVLAVLQQFEPILLDTARDPDSAKRLWKARKGTVAGYGRLKPAFHALDCVIPRSRLTEVLQGMTAIGDRHGITIASVFHAGDGNIHPNLLFDPKEPNAVERMHAASDEIMALCLSVGGTLSGEHGIGIEKLHFMAKLWSDADLGKMRQVRAVFDPQGRANPGKLIPAKRTCGESGTHHAEMVLKPFPAQSTRLTPDGEIGLWL